MTARQYNYHVFLSHNSAQKDWTRRLAGFLRDRGLRVFFDEDSIQLGEDIVVAIENGLRSSRHVLLVLSPDALASQWVALELSTSLYRDPSAASRSIIPVLREECEIPLTLARLKYLDATSNDFDRQVTQLLSAIDTEAVPLFTSGAETARPKPQRSPRRKIEHPGGALRHDSQIYVERDSDSAVRQSLDRGEPLVTIWGARQTGKSSLVVRTLNYAERLGKRTAWIDFSMFAGTSLPQLLFGLAAEIAGQTQTEVPSAESFLSSRRGPISALESCLSRIDVPTLIAFDEVDYLKHIDEMNTFFRFVRAFYGSQFAEQQERPVTLLVSSFLSPREFIDDSFSSPFNIGQQFRVENFKHSQADELLRICGIEVTPKESQSLFSLTGGQPYLTHLIAWLLQGSMSIDEILRNADSIDGPFGMHLEMVASYVAHSRKAKRALEDVARGRKANAYDLVELVDRGILKVESAGAVFTSELYKRYFASNI